MSRLVLCHFCLFLNAKQDVNILTPSSWSDDWIFLPRPLRCDECIHFQREYKLLNQYCTIESFYNSLVFSLQPISLYTLLLSCCVLNWTLIDDCRCGFILPDRCGLQSINSRSFRSSKSGGSSRGSNGKRNSSNNDGAYWSWRLKGYVITVWRQKEVCEREIDKKRSEKTPVDWQNLNTCTHKTDPHAPSLGDRRYTYVHMSILLLGLSLSSPPLFFPVFYSFRFLSLSFN